MNFRDDTRPTREATRYVYESWCPRCGNVKHLSRVEFRKFVLEPTVCQHHDEPCVAVRVDLKRKMHRTEQARAAFGTYNYRAQRFDPVVVHVDKQGNIRFPGHADAACPAGYERRELRTVNEVRSFERHVNLKDRVEWEQRQAIREQQFSEQQSANRRELRSAMERMSQRGRDFAELAMRRNNDRKKAQFHDGFFVEAFSQDSSNRDAYRDERTGWKGRR